MKDIFAVIAADHTFNQKLNYFKYRFYPKGERLAYNPVVISIVATGRCTLWCDMCPTHSMLVPKDYPYIQKNVRDMDFGMFREIIDYFDDALTVHIIGSGEPLLNKDFFEMVDYAAKRKMIVKTFSNGTTIDENIDAILRSRLNGITISLNGHDSEEFKRMTGMDERIYRKIHDSTERLVKERNRRRYNIKIKLSFIIDRYNYKFIPAMMDVGLRLGVDHIFLCNFLPSPYNGLSADERMLVLDEKMIDEIKAILVSHPPSVRKKVTFPMLVDKNMGENRCDTHFSQIRFDGDGNISSCSMMLLDMAGHGNYRERDIWNNDFFKTMRRVFLSRDEKKLPEPCRMCPDNKGVYIG